MMKNLFMWIVPCACVFFMAFTMCSNDNTIDPDPGPEPNPGPPEPKPASFTLLKATGTMITNEGGDTIQLKGTNLGSYTSLEQWMSPIGHGPLSRDKWETTTSDLAGQEWIRIDFNEEVVFNTLVLNVQRLNNQTAYNLVVQKSANGNDWELVGNYKGQINNDVVRIGMGDFVMAHYIRINIDPIEYKNWKITELNLTMNDDYHVRKALIDRFGEEEADKLWDHYCNNWIKESDLDQIKSMGMNVVRLPFFWMQIMTEDGRIKENGFRNIDRIINLCKERNLYVILDLHCSPGGNDGYVTSGMAGYNYLWDSPKYKQMTLDLWKAVATRYKDEPAIACYDALNESWSTSQETTLNTFYKQIYNTIRSVDNKHIICFQAFPNFEFIESPAANNWENVMYQAHYYNTDYNNEASQSGFTRALVSEMINFQQRWNVPVLAGEFSFWQHENVWKMFIAGMNSARASWTNWSYKSREANASRANFAYYTDLSVDDPDLITASIEEIRSVWSNISSDNFKKNSTFIDLIKGNINRTPQVATGAINIKQWDGTYLKRTDNGALTFSATDKKDATVFTLEKHSNGNIAIKAAGKYLSVDEGTKVISCTATTAGERELFKWVDFTNTEFALWGNHGFVSCNGGNTNVTSDRDRVDNWERFSWTIAN